jgi:predicted metal-dependent hydrolase
MEELRKQYQELHPENKEVSLRYKNDKEWIEKKIEEFKNEPKQIEISKELLEKVGKDIETIASKQMATVFRDGKPFAIIGNEYVPHEESKQVIYRAMKQYIDNKFTK